jgi:hypothetical protein
VYAKNKGDDTAVTKALEELLAKHGLRPGSSHEEIQVCTESCYAEIVKLISDHTAFLPLVFTRIGGRDKELVETNAKSHVSPDLIHSINM